MRSLYADPYINDRNFRDSWYGLYSPSMGIYGVFWYANQPDRMIPEGSISHGNRIITQPTP
jgi:hypothetical protein